ncbi:transposase [Mesorhizobium sp.]|uniref:transposase n=1 Tax=Mesorhizobium sp. TaxID=1871066 RepID=UPI0025C67769|nr:transposase [Mesorhizobium sp.]
MVDLASAAGSSVTEVAQAFGVAPSQIYTWRKQMRRPRCRQAVATFARIDVNDLPEVERPVATLARSSASVDARVNSLGPGRDDGYPSLAGQIRTCGTTAYGSYRML